MRGSRSQPRAALFDLDGTLVDREPLMAEALRSVLTERVGTGDLDWLSQTVGRSWVDVHAAIEATHGLGMGFDQLMDSVLGEAAVLVADGFPTRVCTGGRELIERLAARGVAVAIVTGSLGREVPAVLERVGVSELVSGVFAAEDYGPGKPDPSCYLQASRSLSAEPGSCLVFEDSTHGVAAGLAAGMWVIANDYANPPIGHPARQDLSAAHLVVSDLSQLTDDDLLVPLV